MKTGFDNQLYLQKQTEHILKRIESFGKLYLEFGGKLFDDFHAARVLPGFASDAKIRLLMELREKTEIVFVINAGDIEKNKVRADLGITYDLDVMRLIDNLRNIGLYVSAIVISQYTDQPGATAFRHKLELRGERVYIHRPIPGYPIDVDLVVSDEGYGSNDYIQTTRPLVVVTAPGPGSGKMATCLSQLYHDQKRGIQAGYAKFETFPIWNLPLKHPVNLAYEAATADLGDINMIDPFHLEAYGKTAVNYNRDVEVFPLVRNILTKITGKSIYQSPTDMGVNMAGYAIVDDEVCRRAAEQEIIRRYFRALCDYKSGAAGEEPARRIELVMKQLSLKTSDRTVVQPALDKAASSGMPAMAIQLEDGAMVTGKTSNLMNAPAATVLNAVKHLAGIADEIHLLSPIVLEPIIELKKSLGNINPMLTLEEVLITLSICAATSPMVELAMKKLHTLRGCEAHASYMVASTDEATCHKLGLNLTYEPVYPSKHLYYM